MELSDSLSEKEVSITSCRGIKKEFLVQLLTKFYWNILSFTLYTSKIMNLLKFCRKTTFQTKGNMF